MGKRISILIPVILNFLIVAASVGAISLSAGNDNANTIGRALEVKESLDPARKYWLGWEVNDQKEEITFEAEVETTGFVGFGISPSGGSMVGSDLFIAGVLENGTHYSGDYYGTRNGMPTKDDHSDWVLLDASQNETHTYLKFSRVFDTCDSQDYPITSDTNRILWAFGTTDEMTKHSERGSYSTNLLLPEQPVFDERRYSHFDTLVNMEIPNEDTTYWCTIHKGPTLKDKNHIVALEPYLPTIDSETYTHHFIVYNCHAPDGEDPDVVFEKYSYNNGTGNVGNHCFLPSSSQTLPIKHCQEYMFAWAKGGKRMVFPENVGYPINETPGKSQYYMLEIHYDNPNLLSGKKFVTGVRTYHTSDLRDIESTLLTVGHQVNPSLTVPPNTANFLVAGHCASECTKKHLPKEGITIFNVLLHSHISGRKLKLRHFRDGMELPWMDFDNNYDFNYQQNKPLVEFRKILPGDQLTYECTYDSNWNEKNEVIIGGLSSRQEMCETFIWYYPRQNFDYCMSTYPLDQGFKEFGIEKYRAEEGEGLDTYYIEEPATLRGSYADSLSFKFNWTEEFQKEYQEKRQFGTHDYVCFSRRDKEAGMDSGPVKYSNVQNEYVQVDKCSAPGSAGMMLSSFSMILKMLGCLWMIRRRIL